jgi:short-subunit dehydrogenase
MYTASKHAVKGFTDSLRIEVEEIDKSPVSITLIQPTATDTPFPQNARNYMEVEPKLPTPMIDPQKVADAILEAAVKPTRAVKVGMMSKVNTAVSKLAPGLGEKMAAKQADNFKSDQKPRDPDGTLYKAGESGQVHGTGPKS